MNSDVLAQELTRLGDGITAFAIIQNITASYVLAKREFKIRLDGKFCRAGAFITVLWNLGYMGASRWLCATALEVDPPEVGVHAVIARAAVDARCGAILIFGAVTTAMLLLYNSQRWWGVPLDAGVVRGPR